MPEILDESVFVQVLQGEISIRKDFPQEFDIETRLGLAHLDETAIHNIVSSWLARRGRSTFDEWFSHNLPLAHSRCKEHIERFTVSWEHYSHGRRLTDTSLDAMRQILTNN